MSTSSKTAVRFPGVSESSSQPSTSVSVASGSALTIRHDLASGSASTITTLASSLGEQSFEVDETIPDNNPWKTSLVNVPVKDMSSVISNFGTTPYSRAKGKGIERNPSVEARLPLVSTSQAQPASSPMLPLGQRVSFGYTPPPSLPPLEIVYKRGGTPATYLVEEGECAVHVSIYPNGSTYHFLGGAFTSEDLSQPGSIERFSNAITDIQGILQQPKYLSVLPDLEPNMVVIRDLDTKTPQWYYVAFDMGLYILPNPPEFPDKDLLVESLTGRFWEHLEAFPYPSHLPPEDIEVDFLSALVYGANERLLGWNDTPFPFSDVQTQRLIRVYRDLKRQVDTGDPEACTPFVWHIARTMVKIEEYREKAKFGTSDYQLYRPVVPETPSWKVKMTERCLTVILFGAHISYRMRLQGTRVRGTVYLADFRELLNHLLIEWSDSNLLATVFVGANIAFLASPNVNDLQRTASLASTICSLTSLLTGVHHVWQHRSKVTASYEEARQYLSHVQPLADGHDSDLAVTAIFLSIPLVALLYAVFSFSVALGAYCIQNSEIHGKILLAILLGIGGLAGIVTLIFFWYVWRGPRTVQISDEDLGDEVAYGWKTILQGRLRKGRERVGMAVQRVGKRLSRTGTEIAVGKSSSDSVVSIKKRWSTKITK